jgi:hypothetical protein
MKIGGATVKVSFCLFTKLCAVEMKFLLFG